MEKSSIENYAHIKWKRIIMLWNQRVEPRQAETRRIHRQTGPGTRH
jgi:hypothetical protein